MTHGRCIIGEGELPGPSYHLGDKSTVNPQIHDDRDTGVPI
jgi:hypothetical protein